MSVASQGAAAQRRGASQIGRAAAAAVPCRADPVDHRCIWASVAVQHPQQNSTRLESQVARFELPARGGGRAGAASVAPAGRPPWACGAATLGQFGCLWPVHPPATAWGSWPGCDWLIQWSTEALWLSAAPEQSTANV